MSTKWAICGAGKIASDFCNCLNSLPSSEHEIVAVAASKKERAEAFAKTFGIQNSYGSYEELTKLKDVDVVYVSTIHTLHVELCLMFINAGKAVLCEKPMALSMEGCQKILAASKEKGVFFQEGTWSRFFPSYKFIKEQISSGSLGEVKVIQASFCVPISEVPRIKQLELGGGSLLDIGLYAVQAANLVFKGKPLNVQSDMSLDEETGVDKTGVITLRYPNGCFASLVFSSETQGGNNSLVFRGTKGNFEITNNFWCADEVKLPNGEIKKFPLPDVKNEVKFNYGNSQGLTYEAQAVRECLLKGAIESREMPHEDSETIMYICQQALNQHGVKYQHP